MSWRSHQWTYSATRTQVKHLRKHLNDHSNEHVLQPEHRLNICDKDLDGQSNEHILQLKGKMLQETSQRSQQ